MHVRCYRKKSQSIFHFRHIIFVDVAFGNGFVDRDCFPPIGAQNEHVSQAADFLHETSLNTLWSIPHIHFYRGIFDDHSGHTRPRHNTKASAVYRIERLRHHHVVSLEHGSRNWNGVDMNYRSVTSLDWHYQV